MTVFCKSFKPNINLCLIGYVSRLFNIFLNSVNRGDFREFAKFAFNEYGDRVKHWVTINEPYEFSHGGYETGVKAPGRCSKYVNEKCVAGKSGHEVYTVSHNLLLAHAEAVEEFRKCGKVKSLEPICI